MGVVRFVMGPSCTGKSFFVASLPDVHACVDLYEVQSGFPPTLEGIVRSYEACADLLVEAVAAWEAAGRPGDVVLEHTLILAARRPMYLGAVRGVSDAAVEACWSACDPGQAVAMAFLRQFSGRASQAAVAAVRHLSGEWSYLGVRACGVAREALCALRMFEVPTIEEGFSSLRAFGCGVRPVDAVGNALPDLIALAAEREE